MRKSNMWMLIILIVIIVLAGGGYAIFHKSSKPAANTSAGNTTTANNSIIKTKTSPSLGQYLTDPAGRALYTYNNDTSGVSNCTGTCLSAWPAYTATSSSANLPAHVTTFTRSDNGQLQYAYNGMPLYYFTGDSNGQVTGNGQENFQVAKPVAATSSMPSSLSSSSSSSSGYSY